MYPNWPRVSASLSCPLELLVNLWTPINRQIAELAPSQVSESFSTKMNSMQMLFKKSIKNWPWKMRLIELMLQLNQAEKAHHKWVATINSMHRAKQAHIPSTAWLLLVNVTPNTEDRVRQAEEHILKSQAINHIEAVAIKSKWEQRLMNLFQRFRCNWSVNVSKSANSWSTWLS